ncbi:MAG TPA: hypothetical protein DEA28_03375 [Firmicutes bacterium]|nr:hypothetical protein [Bacillota bacterium]
MLALNSLLLTSEQFSFDVWTKIKNSVHQISNGFINKKEEKNKNKKKNKKSEDGPQEATFIGIND